MSPRATPGRPFGAAKPLAADPTATVRPSNLAFLAMAHHRLGEADAARARLADLRTLVASAEWATNADVHAFLREAEATLAAPPAPPPM